VRPFFRLDQRISDAIRDVTKLRGTVEPAGAWQLAERRQGH
jgi:hypothetical protein